MSNLLDKASIILTPTAYNNGEALCVKPSDGSGDFDFSRNSAATRVNAQGFVENVQILSSNLVQNGDFSEEGVQEVSNGSFSQEGVQLVTNGDFATDSDWTKGTGWSISDGKALALDVDGTYLYQNIVFDNNKIYKIQFEISNYVSGEIRVRLTGDSGTVNSVYVSGNNTHTLYLQSNGNTRIRLQGQNNFTGSIDNVSVREVGQDWTLGTGISIGSNEAIFTGISGQYLSQDMLTSGKSYKLVFDVTDYTSGALTIFGGSGNNISTLFPVNSTGTYTGFFVAGGTNNRLYFGNTFNGSITNISVKEVGQNWTLGSGWSIGEDKAVAVSGSATKLQQTISGLSGKKCEVTFTLSNYQGTDVVLLDFGSTSGQSITANGTYTEIGTYDQNYFQLYKGANFSGNITNISVIEITDDTNLPRINYENFSYQDVLGSELNTNTYIADKSANLTLNGTELQIDNGGENYARARVNAVLVSGKTYRAKVTCVNQGTNGASFYVLSARPFGTINMISGETYEVTFVADSFYTPFYENKVGGTGLIVDNISIKEYLGQEVVPNSGCGSWLWEPQSTNLIPYSEQITQFDQNNVTTLNNQTISADGTQNASKVTKLGVSANDRLKEDISISSATSYNVSVFLKNDTIDGTTTLGIRISGGTLFRLGFDWSGSTPSISASHSNGARTNEIIENYGNGWYRVGFSFVSDGTNADFELDLDRGNGGDTTSLFVWGAMLEAQSYATSYIPTSGSTVTRNQDVCTNGGSLATINSTEGTLYFEGAALADNTGTFRSIALSDGTVNNRIIISYTDAANTIRVLVFRNNALQVIMDRTINATDTSKVAISYKFNEVEIWINGVKEGTDTNASMPIGLNQLSFSRGDGDLPFFGKTKALAVFPYLTDAELTELTTI